MGKIIIGGGGIQLEDVTATQSDVIKGKTAYLQDQDDPVSGTLELTGNATDSYVYPGKTYYSTDPKTKRTGTMPTQAARTITPGASAQTVAAGRYLTGAITVPGFALPAANLIKKGTTINIYGRTVTGTFEGYVPTATDLYLRGNNIAGWTIQNGRLDSGGIFINPTFNVIGTLITKKSYNLTPYNYLNVQFKLLTNNASNSHKTIRFILYRSFDMTGNIGTINRDISNNTEATVSFSLSNASYTTNGLSLEIAGRNTAGDAAYSITGYIYRIWLS